MIVSNREEQLAIELYNHDMGMHQGEWMPWARQIDHVRDSYRRQATKIVNTQWFREQLSLAALKAQAGA